MILVKINMCIHIKPTAGFLGFGRGISGFFGFAGVSVSGFKEKLYIGKINLTKYISSYLPWVFPLLRTFLTESDFASQPELKS